MLTKTGLNHMYLSLGVRVVQEMSRPQFPVNTQQTPVPGHVVNGGLIDFQDNFNRGVPDYSGYMNSSMGSYPGMNSLTSSFPMQQGFMPGMQHYHPPGVSGMPGLATQTQLPCISGPPAYLHVNGQTYVPVDSPQGTIASTMPQKQAEPVAAPDPPPRVLTEEEIERRVRERVDAWAASQRKPVYQQAPRVSSRRAVSDEDRAAERIQSVNSGMRGSYASPF